MKRKESGFTLIEVIIILVLLSIISAITIPSIGMIHRQEANRALNTVLMDLSRYSLKAKKNPCNTYSIEFARSDVTYPYNNCYKIQDTGGETSEVGFKQPKPMLKDIDYQLIPGKLETDKTFTPRLLASTVSKITYSSQGYVMMKINGIDDEIVSHLCIKVSYGGEAVISQIVSGYTLAGVKK